MNSDLVHLGLSSWPFSIVVDTQAAPIWADRHSLRRDIDQRLRRIATIGHSSIQVVWADYGAGKSHTLRYIQHSLLSVPGSQSVAAFTELPPAAQGFLDIARAGLADVPTDTLHQIGTSLLSFKSPPARTSGAKDLRRALQILVSGDSDGTALVEQWLQLEPGLPALRSLKAFGLSSRIEDETRAIEVLGELARIVATSSRGGMFVWLLDECQRLADIPPRKREIVYRSLVTLFNACPRSLHLILSFSVVQQAAATALLPADLMSRAASFPTLSLPYLNRDEAVLFTKELLAAHLMPGKTITDLISQSAIDTVVADANLKSDGQLTPRRIMQALEHVFLTVMDGPQRAVWRPIDQKTALAVLDTATQ